MRNKVRRKRDRGGDTVFPPIDPTENLPPGLFVIQVSKGLAMLLLVLLLLSTIGGTVGFYEDLAKVLLAEGNRETAEGVVTKLNLVESGM